MTPAVLQNLAISLVAGLVSSVLAGVILLALEKQLATDRRRGVFSSVAVGLIVFAFVIAFLRTNESDAVAPSMPSPSISSRASSEQPLPTPFPLRVPGNAETGVPFRISEAGSYEIHIESGAYSTWPVDSSAAKPWRSILFVYVNRPIQWGTPPGQSDIEPVNPDYSSLGQWQDVSGQTQQSMETASRGSSLSAVFRAGDVLTFVPIDERGAYNDNRGVVQLVIALARR